MIPTIGQQQAKKPTAGSHRLACPACGDYGTVLLDGAKRAERTMPEIMQHEAPCVCQAGDLWRQLFGEFQLPLITARKEQVRR